MGLVFIGQVGFNPYQMLHEPTTLAATIRLIAETLESDYQMEAEPLFRAAGLDYDKISVPGARYPWVKLQRLWDLAVETTGDSCFGIAAGRNFRATTFSALSFAWLVSDSLRDSLERMCRYHRVISTAPVRHWLEERQDDYELALEFPDPSFVPKDVVFDAFYVGVLQLCRMATTAHFRPLAVQLQRAQPDRPGEYVKAFDAPVNFECERSAMFFDKASLDAPLPGQNIDLVRVHDRVLDDYLDVLDPDRVSTEVRRLLLTLLPAGAAKQKTIATRLNRSLSTLQRQLQAEGTNYKELRDQTRRSMAEEYVRKGKLPLSEIAYLLGFSDQSNFSRAFKRWTGVSPGEFRS